VLRRHAPYLLLYYRADSPNLTPKAPDQLTSAERRAKRDVIDAKYWLYKFADPEDHLRSTTPVGGVLCH